ncbi:anhydro-N-acetylmuramic acid kinase [Mariniblastus fucicola]|uniref:Anhydro-N-acetylmuramic acid kinase n=1 Tax=Mariniblastus fucicola TaxID=980251 RepID=A0A5B9PK37_9BACT|nr:anhydro-N-acetylmuramic acid kinase [Mariniblastus fucicola]QEG22853.1 anhydro-N-acetylmuramic acid kinase [Mariniblastus fucicola]
MLKLFRFADFWNKKPLENSAVRIERALLDRTRRLVAGLNVDDAFESISGSLVVARGHGKSLRVLYCDSLSLPISPALRSACQDLVQDPQSVQEYRSCVAELADVQAAVIEQLKLKAGKYVDRILAVSVTDPGVWLNDFDGVVSYMSLCDATRLAEKTGVSVIDAWPDRDMAVGGKGYPLDPLCLWLLQADRDRKIARRANVAIKIGSATNGYLLPPSDGLDAEVPTLRTIRTEGMDLIRGLLKLSSVESLASPRSRQLLVSGIHSKELLAQWKQIDCVELRTEAMLRCVALPTNASLTAEQLLCTAMKWISVEVQNGIQNSLQQLKSEYARMRAELQEELNAAPRTRKAGGGLLDAFDRSLPEFETPGSITVDAPNPISDALVSRLQNHYAETQVSGSWRSHFSGESMGDVDGPSILAAMLGFMHVDQMPANIPALTGAQQQRILGRLTPGRPNSWRNLLREMADHEPSAMKLRDAV